MIRKLFALTLCGALGAVGCSESTELTQPGSSDAGPTLTAGPSSTTGGGHFSIGGVLDIKFAMSAIQTSADGTGTGQFRHSVIFQDELIEFHSRTTCVTFDAENGRAWIGGVITQNRSTHPAFTTEIHEPGHDIWFRVVDYGEGGNASQADRSTFVGFEGGAGIDTSEEYCELQIWPDGDARTNPVTQGDIQVRVN